MSFRHVTTHVFAKDPLHIIEVIGNADREPDSYPIHVLIGEHTAAADLYLDLAAAERLRDLLSSAIQDYRVERDLDEPPDAEDNGECLRCGRLTEYCRDQIGLCPDCHAADANATLGRRLDGLAAGAD